MFTSISRISFKPFQASLKGLSHNLKTIHNINPSVNSCTKYSFATKKKRVIELNTSRIDFQSLTTQAKQQVTQAAKKSYIETRQKIQSLPWEQMSFNDLCALDQQFIDALQTQLKKDKFNISDQEFLASQLKSGQQIPLGTYDKLDRHYKKVYSLLKNTNDFYDEFPITEEIKKGYLHEIYLTDLKKDKELNFVIARFIKQIAKPDKLEAIAEPTFVKYILTLKRELMLQGIHFETKAEKKESRQKKQQIIESHQPQQLPKIKILQILNYEYEFWQDVKHNRAKNGSQSDFLMQTREVPNPNQSILLRELYPTVNIKYIARHKSLKSTERCFCLKADLLIEIDEKMKRKIKIEWKGPSDGLKNETKPRAKKSTGDEDAQEEQAPRVNYMVIDYENIYDGNPTIRPIFYF